MSNNNSFVVRKDGGYIPVAGYESAPDAIITKVEQLAKVSNTKTTSGTGQIQVNNVPLAAIIHYLDHVGNLIENYGIAVTDASTGTPYYAGNVDPNTGTFMVYSDSGLTTPVTNKSVNYSHYFLAPVLGTLNSDGTITPNVAISNTPNVSLAGSNTNDITLQNAATATGDGTVHTITTGKETITLVASGTATSFTVQFQVQGSDGNWYLTNGTNVGGNGGSGVVGTVGTNAQASSVTSFGQVFQVDLSGWKAFKASLTAVSGGNVTVAGRLTFA